MTPDRAFQYLGALVLAVVMGVVLGFAVSPGAGVLAGLAAGLAWLVMGVVTSRRRSEG